MAIDTKITVQVARGRIGDLIEAGVISSLEERVVEEGLSFEYRQDVWNMAWTFSAGSAFVRSLKALRDNQKRYGFDHEKTTQQQQALARIKYNSTIMTYLQMYSERMTGTNTFFLEDFGFIQQQGSCVFEALINGIEHGSNYCRNGFVTLQFLGGRYGALFLVEDPGQGYTIKKRTPSELDEQYERAGVLKKRAGFSPPKIRGMGTPCFTRSEKAIVGTEKAEKYFRTIILYER